MRALLIGDTHLGFDLPARPRVDRRRRGHDFQANYERAVDAAIEAGVDLVIHAGDVFHKPRPREQLIEDALSPLTRAADAGCQVVILPGNHERAVLPERFGSVHPRIHLISEPRTLELSFGGVKVALAGFPYARKVRAAFRGLVRATGLRRVRADVKLLVVHHCVEGSAVHKHVFRTAPDVIAARDLPFEVAAVLSGHIHRHQVLPTKPPVVYAGSVERTSIAEQEETKGYLELRFEPGPGGGRLAGYRFRPLPARPMRSGTLHARTAAELLAQAERLIDEAPGDAVLRLRIDAPESVLETLTAARLRAIAPYTMNVDARPLRR